MLGWLIEQRTCRDVLFAGCSNCRSIVPLFCAGKFMPHVPVPVEPSPMGPCCGFCGPMPPVFMCTICGTVQGLYMQGMSTQAMQQPGVGPLVAPVVQSHGSPSQSEFRHFVHELVGGLGSSLGGIAGQRMGAWM